MQISETFTLADHWLAMPYKALRHGASLTTPLYNIMRSGTREERQEATRLYHLVQSTMSQIRTACPFVPKDCYRVAFLPVATYNDETGETITPTDYLQYPTDCTLAQRLHLQYAEAEHHFTSPSPSATSPKEEEDTPEPTSLPVLNSSPVESEPTISDCAPVPSVSSDASLDDTTEPKQRRRRRQQAE